MNTLNTKRIGLAMLLAAVSGSVLAAEPGGTEADLLRGPQVVDASGPDGGDTMDGSAVQSQRTGDMPFRAYLGAVRGLNKDAKDNPELTLTEEQKESIKEIGREFQEQMKAFREEHKEAFGEMRERGGERMQERRGERGEQGAKGKDKGKDKGKGKADRERPSPEEVQRKQEQMAELRAQAPSDKDAKKQLWAVLSPAQQAAVKEHVETMRTKRQQRVDKALDRGDMERGDNEHAGGRTAEGEQAGKGRGKAKGKATGKAKGKAKGKKHPPHRGGKDMPDDDD